MAKFGGTYPLHNPIIKRERDPRVTTQRLRGYRCSECVTQISQLEYERNQRCRPCMIERGKQFGKKRKDTNVELKLVADATTQLFGNGGRYGNPH